MKIDIQDAKIELIQWLTTLEDTTIISKLIQLKSRESKDWWEKISDNEKKSIKAGLADADNGKLKENSEAKSIYGKWL